MKQHLLLRRFCRTNVIWGVYRDFHSYNNIETHKFDGTMNRKITICKSHSDVNGVKLKIYGGEVILYSILMVHQRR